MAEDLMDKVFSFFSGDGLTDEKQNMLKHTAKELSQSKYSRFFRVRSEEVDPSFTSFLFSVYKTIYPIKLFMQDERKVTKLKELLISSSLDNSINEIIKRLDYATLDAKSKTMEGEKLIASIQADTEELENQFDNSRMAAANRRYEMVSSIGTFVSYNFPGFFKKFDPHFADGSFLVEPRFPALKTILIIDQIGEFLTVSQPLRPEDEWDSLLYLFRVCEGHDLAVPEHFIAMIKTLREIHTSRILELMVQYTLRNPVWQWKHLTFRETVAEDWLESKKMEANNYILKINNAKKNSQINALTKQIFEATDLVRLENYTVQLSEPYRRRDLEYFYYAEGLNYLKAFLDDYVERDIKELCDILLIRGQWTNNTMAREMSEAFHELQACEKDIDEIDEVLSDDGPDGSRLRAAMLRIDRDSTQTRYVNVIINKLNTQALDIINLAAQDLIVIGKHMKNLIDDVQKKHPELLVNWREINLASKEPIAQRMIDDFKRINFFVQLMHLCTS
ncbi:MAG: DUF5312 family protein [Treponema sp.]|nr:DUF5312 family protein [Treponema sp.]